MIFLKNEKIYFNNSILKIYKNKNINCRYNDKDCFFLNGNGLCLNKESCYISHSSTGRGTFNYVYEEIIK